MNKDNFRFLRKDYTDGHEDYWYGISTDEGECLREKYMEQGLRGVFRVVYSKDEDVVRIEKAFDFNYDVVLSDDKELHDILKSLSE